MHDPDPDRLRLRALHISIGKFISSTPRKIFFYFFWIMWNQDTYMDLIGGTSFLFQPVYVNTPPSISTFPGLQILLCPHRRNLLLPALPLHHQGIRDLRQYRHPPLASGKLGIVERIFSSPRFSLSSSLRSINRSWDTNGLSLTGIYSPTVFCSLEDCSLPQTETWEKFLPKDSGSKSNKKKFL